MKRLLMCLAGAMMVFSLAACSPTKVEPGVGETAADGTKLPGGLSPEMMETETTIDPSIARLPDPNAPKMDSIVVYYTNEDGTGLTTEMVDVDLMDEEIVAEQLVEFGVLPEGTEVYSLVIEGGQKAGPGVADSETGNGDRIGILDLTQLDTLEGTDEKLMIYAIVNTFCDNYELDKMQILVNGEEYATGLSTDGYLYPADNYEKIN